MVDNFFFDYTNKNTGKLIDEHEVVLTTSKEGNKLLEPSR
ncbi:hypothetical protein BSG1_16750 [Bacillus sp. SG-1]|nr:hypothetical protein BSG1_16750 [Bacillus sp. SG-1]